MKILLIIILIITYSVIKYLLRETFGFWSFPYHAIAILSFVGHLYLYHYLSKRFVKR